MSVDPRHPIVLALVLRLLRGETITVIDEHGRIWRSEASRLFLVLPGNGEAAPILEHVDAYEVALRLASLRLPVSAA